MVGTNTCMERPIFTETELKCHTLGSQIIDEHRRCTQKVPLILNYRLGAQTNEEVTEVSSLTWRPPTHIHCLWGPLRAKGRYFRLSEPSMRTSLKVCYNKALTSHLVSSIFGRNSACSFLKATNFFSSSSRCWRSCPISSWSFFFSCWSLKIWSCKAC